jgi:Glycosyl hydrolases family 2, sugar binding domain/Glycosyl hydrolases family 2/Glycosyl hydrolases family 2, TIM barrel domain
MKFLLPNLNVKVFGRAALILAIILFTRAGEGAGWNPGKAPLMTRWAAAVNPTNVWPEYPRPQLVRPDWENLNGLWDYAITPASVGKPPPFAGKILVPFSPESALSGVMARFDGNSKLWYHRTFSVPASWRGRRLRLHFGAVDWRCRVWVNGHEIGEHQGGYDAFTFDITDALRWNGAEDMVVCVSDPTDDGDQPRGKQSLKPEGIFYTATSGIWQTVWLEPVPEVCIERLRLSPDIDAHALRLRVAVSSFSDNLQVEAVASAGAGEVARIAGAANTELVLNLPDPHLWSPDDPFLYDLKVTLKDGHKVLDSVASYFGMRKIALRADDQGITRIALNNKFIFELGALDQGFWPDGIYTAPTDAALRHDFEFLKRAGFNLVRMHVKVEQARGYYWCDKLGLLIWQDMPSGNNATAASRQEFEIELQHMIRELYNHPAIVQWDLFNEGWGQFDTESLTKWIKAVDPSRLVDDASGWTDMRVGDVVDMHNYPGPDSPAPEPHRAAVLGEFGGLGLAVPDHLWSSNSWAYVMLTNRDELAAGYAQALKRVWELHRLRGLSAAVYTQLADVETECNGLQTYDRAVAKIDPEVLRIANRGGFWGTPMKIIQPDALFGRATWKYTTEQPIGDWFKAGFDDSAWKDGVAGFGATGTPGIVMNTTWNTSDIWLRREFTLEPEDLSGIKLQIFHDEDVDVYLNGVLAVKLSGFITDYSDFEISKEAAAALHPGGNTIAVHCHQTVGGQGVDVGIFAPQTARESDETGK